MPKEFNSYLALTNQHKPNMKALKTLLFCVFTIGGFAQIKTSIGVMASPSLANISINSDRLSYDYTYLTSYGITADFSSGNWSLSTGITRLNQGMAMEIQVTTVDQPEGTGEVETVHLLTEIIAVPIIVNYQVYSSGKIDYFAGAGVEIGYLYKQQFWNKAIDLFKDGYYGFQLGIGLDYHLNDRFTLRARPNFLYQLRKDLPAEESALTPRLYAYQLDLGIAYTF